MQHQIEANLAGRHSRLTTTYKVQLEPLKQIVTGNAVGFVSCSGRGHFAPDRE
jgi:hypothetical protein